MSTRAPQDQDKYVLRLPNGMRDRLKAEAEKNTRTMNAEIIFRLQWSIEEDQANERAKAHYQMLEQVSDGTLSSSEVPDMPGNDGIPDPKSPDDYGSTVIKGRSPNWQPRPLSPDLAAKLEEITGTLSTLLEENKFLREEVSALYQQRPKEGR